MFDGIARRFVELVRSKPNWSLVTILSCDESEVLSTILEAAGFGEIRIAVGKLLVPERDCEQTATGQYIAINKLCPCKVFTEAGDHHQATGWLETAFNLVIVRRGSLDEVTREIAKEIERSVPLKPIRLTPEGDFLKECSSNNGRGYFIDHYRDFHTISNPVGVHQYCGGFLDRIQTTADLDVLRCRHCGLRVTFPHSVNNYGDLRNALERR